MVHFELLVFFECMNGKFWREKKANEYQNALRKYGNASSVELFLFLLKILRNAQLDMSKANNKTINQRNQKWKLQKQSKPKTQRKEIHKGMSEFTFIKNGVHVS